MNWQEIYKNKGAVQEKPSKHITGLVPMLRREGVRKIFDHGCGTGRHVKYLFGEGFEVWGTDYSPDAVEICRKSVGERYAGNIIVCDLSTIPLANGYFDCVISSQVIQHALKPSRERAINEIKRVTKIGGFVFIRTISPQQYGFGLGSLVEENTYIDIPGLPDGSTPHHYFSEAELREYFENFEILLLKHESSPASNPLWSKGLNEWILLARKTD